MGARDASVQQCLLEPSTSVFAAARYFRSVPEAYRKQLEEYVESKMAFERRSLDTIAAC